LDKAFHVHLSAVDAIKTFVYVIIIGVFWRLLTYKLHTTPVGQAMAIAY
jgi:hypothetical protein